MQRNEVAEVARVPADIGAVGVALLALDELFCQAAL